MTQQFLSEAAVTRIRNICPHKNLYVNVCGSLFARARAETTQMSIHWGSTMRSVHVTGYYPDMERSNVLTPALEKAMLSRRSQTPKATDSAGFRLLMSRDTNPQGSENTLVVVRAGGRGGTTGH